MMVSVVTPTLNEEESVEKVITDIKKTLGSNVEIIVVDSGTDKTAEIAEKLGAIVYKVNFKGYGNQMRYGLERATGDIILTTDCDGTYPMEQIPTLIKSLEQDYDIVSGCRFTFGAKHVPFLNRLANVGFSILLRLLYGIKITDVSTGMKACKKEVIKAITWETNCTLPVELLVRPTLKGYKICEIPIDFKERLGGKSKLKRFSMGMAYLKCIFKYKFNLKFSGEKL